MQIKIHKRLITLYFIWKCETKVSIIFNPIRGERKQLFPINQIRFAIVNKTQTVDDVVGLGNSFFIIIAFLRTYLEY